MFCSVGGYYPNRVPGGRFEVGDDNLRAWQGVIVYRAVALISLSAIKSESGEKNALNGASTVILFVGGQIERGIYPLQSFTCALR